MSPFICNNLLITISSFRKFLEHGFHHEYTGGLGKIVMKAASIEKLEPEVYDCMSKSIVTHTPQYDALTPGNLKKLFLVYAYMMAAASLILMMEHYVWFRTQLTKRKMAELRESFDPTKVQMSESYHQLMQSIKGKTNCGKKQQLPTSRPRDFPKKLGSKDGHSYQHMLASIKRHQESLGHIPKPIQRVHKKIGVTF